jgi:hypothetical protein
MCIDLTISISTKFGMGKDAGAAAPYKLTIGSLHVIIGN